MLAPLRVSALACAASLAALSAVAFGLSGSEPMIERSYAGAFDRLEQARSATASRLPPAFNPAHLHLSRFPMTNPLGPALAVGDQITLAQRAGGSAAYEVIEVRPMSADPIGGSAGAAPGAGLARLLMVTAVTTGSMPAQTIRLIIDADGPTDASPVVRPHAL